jgi:cell division protein ZapA
MPNISDKKQTVKVIIFGEEYPILGSADPEYILRVADYVDKKMREIASKSKNKSPDKLAILTALNIAGELIDLEDNKTDSLTQVEDRAKNILELLDSRLSESSAD